MRAVDLDDALALQNAPEFGLTAGLHSLDPDEITHWVERVQAGNVYVNRHTTGAILRRQPFGGWKHSSVGPGAKAGGPNDLLRFVRPAPPTALDLAAARDSHRHWHASTFGVARDESGLHSERNELRYRPLDAVIVRAASATTETEVAVLRDAATVTGVPMVLSPATEPDDALIAHVNRAGARRLRALAPVTDVVARACHAANIPIDDTPVTGHGRVELPRWLREQALSRTVHRHGRVPTA
jgi:RHH-type proline utilization regulon transcriptional repressor/proline dehydrogenase/delta 1-pyrroline-5-carboxylate dehydrogenase